MTSNPSDVRTYWPEQLRRHALRRQLHELMAHPCYHIRVVDGQLRIGPKEAITPEAREFIANNRNDLVAHVSWLGESNEV